MYRTFFKRLIDVAVSFLLLLLFLPLILLLTFIFAFLNKGRPFFFQLRPGKDERPLHVIKFKTMTDAVDPNGNLLPDRLRMTRFGSFARKYSLDELPQLFNVLKGDMSLVGPRPLLFRYLPLYTSEQRRRHGVRPGITGWAQVNGRNSISWREKFEYDTYYVDHVSFSLDMRILLKTVYKVLKKEGVNQSAERPMNPFNGNN